MPGLRAHRVQLGAGLAGAGVLGLVLALVLVLAPARPALDGRDLPWPTRGVASVAVGEAVVGGPGSEGPRAMGSIAKLVVALVALDLVPPDGGALQGWHVFDSTDEVIAAHERAAGGAVIDVSAGSALTYREMLEAALVASSNNHTRSLARFVSGDEGQFLDHAREWLRDNGLDGIELADLTGMAPETRATARDLIALSRLALADPLISEIVEMPETRIASAQGSPPRTYVNTNGLLGRFGGVDGLKTGMTDAAGHSIVVTAPVAEGSDEHIIVVILGAPSAAERDTAAAALLAAARSAL
ncbi:hypothetical protein GCM10010921_21920 [Microbacterium album]|uniref:Peptidase S11 D-alanyl-D-alanine carboxypeptidase A N-terminal domain-containing protein n=2 Tax=Microbacterium album TaxID=2053191 RepID=A0A917IHD9_9MICO|nr:hypothetical protein GCM10010921_21920 [Microbacterium album]